MILLTLPHRYDDFACSIPQQEVLIFRKCQLVSLKFPRYHQLDQNSPHVTLFGPT